MRRFRLETCVLAVLIASCGGAGAGIRAGKMPDGATYYGVWQSPQYGEMNLCQSGTTVHGDFVKNERRGRIHGTVEGDVLQFQWEERRELVQGRPSITRGHGYFRLEIGDDDDHYLRGQWGHDNSYDGGGPWNAVKLRRRTPTGCGGPSPSAPSQESYDEGSYDSEAEDEYEDAGDPVDAADPADGADPDLQGLDEL